jgi:hypothetical protein
MKIFTLYLLLQGFGWIKFEQYETMEQCELVKTHVVEGQPDRLEGLCLEVEQK